MVTGLFQVWIHLFSSQLKAKSIHSVVASMNVLRWCQAEILMRWLTPEGRRLSVSSMLDICSQRLTEGVAPANEILACHRRSIWATWRVLSAYFNLVSDRNEMRIKLSFTSCLVSPVRLPTVCLFLTQRGSKRGKLSERQRSHPHQSVILEPTRPKSNSSLRVLSHILDIFWTQSETDRWKTDPNLMLVNWFFFFLKTYWT